MATETGRWASGPHRGSRDLPPSLREVSSRSDDRGGCCFGGSLPPAPSHKFCKRRKLAYCCGRGIFIFTYNKFFKGGGLGCRLGRRWTVATGDHRPPLYPPRGRAHPARRMSLSCREFRKSETRPSKSSNARLGSCAHPRKGPLSPGLLQKRGFKGGWSRLPPRSAMDGRHWRPSPPFEMRCIEYSPPPVQKSYPPFLIPLTGGGRGWGEMGYPPVAPMA